MGTKEFIQDRIKELQRAIENCNTVIKNNQYNIDETKKFITHYEQELIELNNLLGVVVSAPVSFNYWGGGNGKINQM
jgi:hypothetical protein